MRGSFRKTAYLVHGAPVSLPFIEAIADQRPEAVDAPLEEAARRGPRRRYNMRRGKPEPLSPAEQANYERVMRRIMREGA